MAGRIEDNAVPLQIQHLGSHDDAALIAVARREKLEFQIKFRRSCGHINVEGIDINRVAQPFHPLAVGINFKSGEGIDPPGGE